MVMSKRPVTLRKRGYSCSMPGVWRALAHNEGAVVIYHSPKACGHITCDMQTAMHYRLLSKGQTVAGQYTTPLLVSGLAEEHSIFGGADLLRECVAYTAERYRPQYIVIANSCVAGVIGDDTRAVAAEAREALGIPVMAVPYSGFLDGDYYAGFYHAGKALADEFMSPRSVEQNTVTLLGDRNGPDGDDAQEITRLLAYFGLDVVCHFPSHASLADIRLVPSSRIIIALGGTEQSYSWISRLGMELAADFAVPFFRQDYPAGWQATRIWLQKIGEFLDQKCEASQAEKEQEQLLHRQAAEFGGIMRGKRFTLCVGRPLEYFRMDWIMELLDLASIKLDSIVVMDGLSEKQRQAVWQEAEKLTDAPIYSQATGDEAIRQADLVLTTHELATEGVKQFFLPLLPPAGVGGLIRIMDGLKRLDRRPKRRGGILYG